MIGRRQVIGQLSDKRDGFGMIVVIGAHYGDGILYASTTARSHGWEQDHLLLGHMVFHFPAQHA